MAAGAPWAKVSERFAVIIPPTRESPPERLPHPSAAQGAGPPTATLSSAPMIAVTEALPSFLTSLPMIDRVGLGVVGLFLLLGL